MGGYVIAWDRFEKVARSDGLPHYLVPFPKCRLCSVPMDPKDARKWTRCYNCSHKPPVDGERLLRILAATLYVPDGLPGYPHSREILDMKDTGAFAAAYSGVLQKYVLPRAFPELRPTCVIPTPSSRTGRVGAGTEALARELAKGLGAAYVDLLEFTRAVWTQKGLTLEERRRNMEGAMRTKQGTPRGISILVDDVVTTGSTVHEAARALAEAGGEGVVALAAGRDASVDTLERAGVVRQDGA